MNFAIKAVGIGFVVEAIIAGVLTLEILVLRVFCLYWRYFNQY